MKTYFEVRTGDKIRFSSVSQTECEKHAQDIYKTEKVIADIFEIKKESK